jgi:hypothetical protein
MTAVPAFLQRLVPSTSSAGQVRAALAPRFAAPDISNGSTLGLEEEASEPARAFAQPDTTAHLSLRDTGRHSHVLKEMMVQTPPSTHAAPDHPSHPDRHLPTATRAAQASTQPVMTEHAHIRSDARQTWLPRASSATAAPLDMAQAPLSHTLSRESLPSRTADMQRPQHAPLREATLAQHAALQRQATPTIVQVTIDRVDVRAPAIPPSTGASPKPRPAPTLTLADYLNQRGRSPNGGSR